MNSKNVVAILGQVNPIVDEVRKRGDAAVKEYVLH